MELLRNLFEGYPNLWGGGAGTFRAYPVAGHCVWHYAG